MKKIATEEIPKINEIDEAIFILKETIKTLQLKVAELEAKQKPYRGRVVKYPDFRIKKRK